MAEKFSFMEGACLNKPPLFCGMNYELWCIRIKFFVNFIDKKIWEVITNSYLMPISEIVSFEIEHLDCVAMNIIVLHLILMNCSRFQNAVLPKKCGISLKSVTRIQGVP